MFKLLYELCDVVSALIFCPDDATYLFLLSDDGPNELTIPSAKARPEGWQISARKLVKEVNTHIFKSLYEQLSLNWFYYLIFKQSYF